MDGQLPGCAGFTAIGAAYANQAARIIKDYKAAIIIPTLKGGIIMAVAHKSMISFGLVAIPVAMYTATQENDIHFNQLHKEDNSRIKYKKTCAHCGKEITTGDIIKGYEYDKDHYVVVTDEEIEKIKTEKEKSIQILHFAQLNQMSPVYYDKTYQVIPEPGGDKAFELLRSALMAEQKIAIGKTVIGTKDTLMAIIPREDGMLISTMFYEDEIKDLPKSYNKPEVAEPELKMAKALINSMDTPFNPAEYTDEYQMKLKELIEQKINGQEIVAAKEDGQPSNVINLMDALKASLELTKPAPKKKSTKKEKGA
jgi:DNA end-binding protein Ku